MAEVFYPCATCLQNETHGALYKRHKVSYCVSSGARTLFGTVWLGSACTLCQRDAL